MEYCGNHVITVQQQLISQLELGK